MVCSGATVRRKPLHQKAYRPSLACPFAGIVAICSFSAATPATMHRVRTVCDKKRFSWYVWIVSNGTEWHNQKIIGCVKPLLTIQTNTIWLMHKRSNGGLCDNSNCTRDGCVGWCFWTVLCTTKSNATKPSIQKPWIQKLKNKNWKPHHRYKNKNGSDHILAKKWNAWDAFCYVCIPIPNILLCLISGSLRLFFFSKKQKFASPLADGVPDNPVMRTCKGVQAWNFIIHNHALSYIIIQHHTTPDSRIHYRTSCLLFVLLHSFTTAAQVRELAATIHWTRCLCINPNTQTYC